MIIPFSSSGEKIDSMDAKGLSLMSNAKIAV
jgi:hypothetical protein